MTIRQNVSNKKLSAMLTNSLNILLPVLLAFVLGGIIIGIMGENPFEVYSVLFSKALLNGKGLLRTLHYAAPLLLTGLGIAITFKAGIFNMGVEGSALLGGLAAAVVGFSINTESVFLHISLCIIAAVAVGILYSLIPALLKVFFKVDEMVVTLMLNYAVIMLVQFLVEGPFRDPSLGYVSTPAINSSAMFKAFGNTSLTPFIFVSIAVFILMLIVFKKSKLGYELTAIGKNPAFAEGTGMRVKKKIIIIMLISGALGGLAGAGWLMSEKMAFTMGFSGSPGLGWDGMLISLVGLHSPVGIIFGAVFFAALKVGSQSISINTNVPPEIITIIQALIILFFAIRFLQYNTKIIDKTSDFFRGIFSKKKSLARLEENKK